MRLIQITIYFVLLTGCVMPSQMYWDKKIQEFCKKDGGVTVYEKVEINKKNYPNIKLASNGEIIIPSEDYAKTTDPFYIADLPEKVINETPRVWRRESYLMRRYDNKIIAKSVFYTRRGGDLIAIDNESHFSCKEVEGFRYEKLNSAVSIK